MKGVMSSSRGKETYVVIFLRSFAECSNRWTWPKREDERIEGGRGRKMVSERQRERECGGGEGEETYLEITSITITTYKIQHSVKWKCMFSNLAVTHSHIHYKTITGLD